MTKKDKGYEELVEEIRDFGLCNCGRPSAAWAKDLISLISTAIAEGEARLPGEVGRGTVVGFPMTEDGDIGLITHEWIDLRRGDEIIALRKEEEPNGR